MFFPKVLAFSGACLTARTVWLLVIMAQTSAGPLKQWPSPFAPTAGSLSARNLPFLLPHQSRLASANRSQQASDLKNFWLIPQDPVSCTRPDRQKIIAIDKESVTVEDCLTGSKTLKFPGCVFIHAEMRLLRALSRNLFANVQFQWTNLPQLNSNLRCEHQEPNGCNGVGNNCYYCDICNGIVELQEKSRKVKKADELDCPTQPRVYELEREFNTSEWSGLDENHNGVIDFLEDEKLSKIRSYLRAIDVVGFGTLSITFQLAQNASSAQLRLKQQEEDRIKSDFVKRYRNSGKSIFTIEREAQNEINYWHKNSYLPWLLNVNQLACVTFSFDVCLNKPSSPTDDAQSPLQCV